MNKFAADAQGLEPEQEKHWARIVARAWDDEEFRQRLLTEPAKTLREAGFEVPDDVVIEIVDQAPQKLADGDTCVRLPGRPLSEDWIEDDLSSPDSASNEPDPRR